MKYPIAEIFTAPQGEGLYAGTLMTFVRFAGCNVGTRYPPGKYVAKNDPRAIFPVLPNYTNECHLYDGRTFACDTDYVAKKSMTDEEIYKEITVHGPNCRRVCLTGGEPLLHKLEPLVRFLAAKLFFLHLETSGTIPFHIPSHLFHHIAVSPKKNCLESSLRRAHEIKILVDANFSFDALPKYVLSLLSCTHDKLLDQQVYFQPVNGEHSIDRKNLDHCLALQRKYPAARISAQLHKDWGTK